jgi:hypothetical protein
MRVSRRTFALGLAGTALAGRAGTRARVLERRVYSAGSVLPPREVLERNGIRAASVRHTHLGAEYRIPFASLESRSKAWDRFNTDPAWCALRDQGAVHLLELAVTV